MEKDICKNCKHFEVVEFVDGENWEDCRKLDELNEEFRKAFMFKLIESCPFFESKGD